MDPNQQGMCAFASNQEQEWTTFSCKVLFEVT